MTITIELPDDTAQRLTVEANRIGVKLEEYVQMKLEVHLDADDPEFAREADYLLKKNAELYRRLA